MATSPVVTSHGNDAVGASSVDAKEKMTATRSASATVELTNQEVTADATLALTDEDVETMLETMKQSARQLDGILQRLCEAEGTSAEAAEDDKVDGDAMGELEPVAGLKNVQNLAVETYFEAIATSFDGDISGSKVFSHDALLTLRSNVATQSEMDAPMFEGLATDATFLFSEPAFDFEHEAQSIESSSDGGAKLAWQQAEVNTLTEFQQKLKRCLTRVDHSIPENVSSGTGLKLLAALSSGDCLLTAIQAIYPTDRVEGSSRVEWRRGNRICKIHAHECASQRQWGLQIVLSVDCVARAQALSATDPTVEPQLGPALSCSTTSCVFVPKKAYEDLQLDSLDLSTSLRLSLLDEARQNEQLLSNDSTPDMDVEETVLPELLTVYHYGSHATLGSDSDKATSTRGKFDSTRGFQKLQIHTPLPRNRIVQAACGRFHSLLLNDLGVVFSFGHAMDGCLGHGDAYGQAQTFVAEPKLVEFFFDKAIVVHSVAVGGDDLTGFHSAAVTRDGAVYTWGVGIALGLGSIQSKSLPQLVKMPVSSPTVAGEPDNSIESIACGSGFCVAIAADGSAFAWGKWSDGRLGLGTIPIINRSSRLHGSHRQLQRFQLYPKRIGPGHVQWRKISCGDAHCIGLSRDGRVFTWGRGRQGQLGLGDGRSAMAPVLVPSLAKAFWLDVAAGQDWSMAVDGHGAVWSWGACGGAVLGQFSRDDADKSSTIAEVLLQRQQQLHQQRQQHQQSTKAAVGLTLPRFVWLRPRPIPSLSHGDVAIRSVSGGARHAAAVSMQGDLYVWGSPLQGLPSQPTLVVSQEMQGTIAEQVFCGGSQIIALASGSFLARDLQQLYSALQAANEADIRPNQEPEPRDVRATTGADVVLLVGGGRALYAHKLVLARRSSVFRELILNEERALDSEDAQATASSTQRPLTELLLPQLRVDIARIVLEFLYTDNLTKSLDPLSYLIRDVLRAARQYKIPRLIRICRERIMGASYVPLGTLLADMEEDENDDEELDTQGHALNQDLAYAFGDSTWADVKIVAENQSIPVHRSMLIARSEYFRALLAFGDQQQHLQASAHMREVVVEESYLGMLRVLRFIYNDELTTLEIATHVEGSGINNSDDEEEDVTERLLEDLIAADKYGLMRMKRLCEHHIEVTPTNCVDVLVVADLVHAQHLKQLALTFMQTHLHVLTTSVAPSASGSVLQRLAIEFPHLLTELHDYTQQHTQQQMLLRDWQKQLETQWQQHQDAQAKQRQAKQAQTKFPWVPLTLALVFATLYLTMMNAHESDYPIVPAINVVVLGGLFSLAFLGKL